MHDLTPLNALAGDAPANDTIGTLTLTENPELALASVAARKGQERKCKAALKQLLGKPAPGPGKACLRDPEAAFWTGPDQWMVGAPYDTHEDLADQLSKLLGAAASVTEQSDAWVCFDLRGAAMEDAMALLGPLNIQSMKTGDATRTSIHHLGCFVIRRDPSDWVRILGPRSSAGSLHHAIIAAMKSVA